ncbi:UTRA domain-containing protein [Nonomuraea sp. NPDC049695]|uniref:UTRA domain-containing protein n=1 Tax=Nonomuraea sp. NPDC049695 TaxID=3154734 RepID=UPI00344538E0
MLAPVAWSRPREWCRSGPERRVAFNDRGIKPKVPVMLRRTLVEHDNEPTEISSTWSPVSVAEGTALAESEDLKQGVRRYVEAAAGTALDHIIEHITARNPTKEERTLLDVKSSATLLTVYAVTFDATGKPWVVVESVLPGDRQRA